LLLPSQAQNIAILNPKHYENRCERSDFSEC
jgi:hypothetical protein